MSRCADENHSKFPLLSSWLDLTLTSWQNWEDPEVQKGKDIKGSSITSAQSDSAHSNDSGHICWVNPLEMQLPRSSEEGTQQASSGKSQAWNRGVTEAGFLLASALWARGYTQCCVGYCWCWWKAAIILVPEIEGCNQSNGSSRRQRDRVPPLPTTHTHQMVPALAFG